MNWYYIDKKSTKPDAIIGISDTGMCLLRNGTIRESDYREKVRIGGERIRIYKLIAEHFLQTVRRPDQTCIDHITHNPIGMNINDVRNLRWCTHKENLNFEEYKENRSKVMKGKPSWNKGLRGKDYLNHYKDGKVSNQYLKEVK